jgi:hypothetical protein
MNMTALAVSFTARPRAVLTPEVSLSHLT